MFDKDDDDYLEYLYLMGDEDDKEELETWFGKAGAKQIIEENTGHKRASDEEDDYEPVGCLMSIFPALLLVIFIALWIGLCVAGEKLIAFSNEHRNPYEGYKDDYNLIAKNYDNVFVSKPTISARSRETFGYDVPNKRTYYFNNDGIYKLEMTVQQGKDDIHAIYRLIKYDYDDYFDMHSEQKKIERSSDYMYSWEMDGKGTVDMYVGPTSFKIVINSTDLEWIEYIAPDGYFWG